MDNNFTHILCVKLLNTETNEVMTDSFLLNVVKEIITSASQVETFPYNNILQLLKFDTVLFINIIYILFMSFI